jgi:hypothetical protein
MSLSAAATAAGGARLVSTGLVARLKAAGLQVHPYTLRDEPRFVPGPLGGDVGCELALLFAAEGVDGIFADYPATAAAWLRARRGAVGEGDVEAGVRRREGGEGVQGARPKAPAAGLPWSAALSSLVGLLPSLRVA